MSQVSSIGAGGSGSGDVVGPGSSTDNAVVRFDGTTGKLIQNSLAILSDAGALSGLTQLDVDNIDVNGNTISSTDVNGNINLTPNAAGNVVLDGISWPNTGSASGDILYGSSANALSTLVIGGIGSSLNVSSSNFPFWLNPTNAVSFQEDFMFFQTAYFTRTSANGGSITPGTSGQANHPGIYTMSTGTSGAIGYGQIQSYENFLVMDGGTIFVEWDFKLSNLSDGTDTYTLRVGLVDSTNATDGNDGVFFRYTDGVNSGNWVLVARNGGVESTTNSSTAVSTNWTKASILITPGTPLATFYINGVSIGTVNTNIPTSNATGLSISILKSVGTNARTVLVDYCRFFYQLNASR